MEYFNSGFTERSYFNIIKEITMNLYKQSPSSGELDFSYSVDKKINASVAYDINVGKDVLVINEGTITEIFSMMKSAFAQNDILIDFGNSAVEKNINIEGRFIKDNCSIIFNADVCDDKRNILSLYSALFALRFIVSHELGHINNGHTKLLHNLYMDSKMSMRLEKYINNKRYCLDRRTLEMDADASAATNSIDNVIHLYCERSHEIFNSLNNPEDVFFLWAFAITSVFLTFELDGVSRYEEISYYLPNYARFWMVIDAAYQTARTYIEHGMAFVLNSKKKKLILR